MVSLLRVLDGFLGRLAEVLTGMAVLVQTLVILAQVIWRYFLKSPLVWGDELARYLLVFISFFGGYMALRTDALAKVDLLVGRLPHRFGKAMMLVAHVLVAVFLVVVLYYGSRLVMSLSIVEQRSPAMRLPMYWVYGVIPVAAAMMLVRFAVSIGDLLTKGEGSR